MDIYVFTTLLSLEALLIERVIDEAAVCTYTMLQLCSAKRRQHSTPECANISDALDVPITDPSRTNNAPSTINTRQLPQYATSRSRAWL